MNRAADDPLPPFTCQKAAQLTTKSLQNHACYHAQHKLLVVGTQQQQTKGPTVGGGGPRPRAPRGPGGGGGGRSGQGAGPGARGGTEDDD
jgi:hypothetical protein